MENTSDGTITIQQIYYLISEMMHNKKRSKATIVIPSCLIRYCFFYISHLK